MENAINSALVELGKEMQCVIARAKTVEIKNDDDFLAVGGTKKEIIGFLKQADEKWDELIGDAYSVHRGLCKQKTDFCAPLKEARTSIDKKMMSWEDEQKRIRDEAQRKIDEEARKEREKKESEARAQREKEEASRRAQEEAERKASATKNEAQRKKLLEEAECKRKEADAAAAKAYAKEQAAATTVAAVLPETTKVEGQSRRDNWKFVCSDPIAFVKWAVANNELSLLTFDQSSCNAHAKKIKKELIVPGGKFFNDKGYTNR